METMQQAVAKKAAQCGCDISEVRIIAVDIDNTWGCKAGYVVVGPDAIAERVARFCAAWTAKHGKPSTYDSQSAYAYLGRREVWAQVGAMEFAGMDVKGKCGLVRVTGFAFSTRYFPCAD